jgi:hypothetical protein
MTALLRLSELYPPPQALLPKRHFVKIHGRLFLWSLHLAHLGTEGVSQVVMGTLAQSLSHFLANSWSAMAAFASFVALAWASQAWNTLLHIIGISIG